MADPTDDKLPDPAAAPKPLADAAALKAAAAATDAAADQGKAEEVRKQSAATAAAKLAQIKKNVAGPMLKPSDVAKDGEALVDCVVPKSFIVTLDDHRRVQFMAGVERVPESLAKHWYVLANKVKAR